MSVLRAFIAIDLPEVLQARLRTLNDELRPQFDELPVRWVPVENIHLTLKFLGDVSENNVAVITEILHSECAAAEPFEVSVGDLGLFPDARRARVIWVGVDAGEQLPQLQQRLEAAIVHLGYPAEKRPFSPHLTLGRVQRHANARQQKTIAEIVAEHPVGLLAAAVIDEVALFKSELKSDGAVYTKLAAASLIA